MFQSKTICIQCQFDKYHQSEYGYSVVTHIVPSYTRLFLLSRLRLHQKTIVSLLLFKSKNIIQMSFYIFLLNIKQIYLICRKSSREKSFPNQTEYSSPPQSGSENFQYRSLSFPEQSATDIPSVLHHCYQRKDHTARS